MPTRSTSSLTAAERFTAVQTGDVDLLMRNTTWTQSRTLKSAWTSDLRLTMTVSNYGPRKRWFSDPQVADIGGSVVCTSAGTTTEKNIADAASEAGEYRASNSKISTLSPTTSSQALVTSSQPTVQLLLAERQSSNQTVRTG